VRVDGVRVDGVQMALELRGPTARLNEPPLRRSRPVKWLVRDSPRVRGEGWAFIGGLRVRDPDLLKLAFKGARAHFRVHAAQVC